MSASKHQLAASAYHLKPADVQKLLLQANKASPVHRRNFVR